MIIGNIGEVYIDMNINKCLMCGSCCRVFGIYELTARDLKKIDSQLVQKCHLYKNGAIMRTIGFSCVALKNNKCTIYSNRPSVCRRFLPHSNLCQMARRQDKTNRYE